jgi:hypothetical protein
MRRRDCSNARNWINGSRAGDIVVIGSTSDQEGRNLAGMLNLG